MMIHPVEFRQMYEDESLDKIIRERDKIIREIRRFEKNKFSMEDYTMCPDPETIYRFNLLYLAELCYLINEKAKH